MKTLCTLLALIFALTAFAQQPAVTGRTWRESRAAWEPLPKAPAGAPNVFPLVLDDVGFAQLGSDYGSEIKRRSGQTGDGLPL
ncbi:MAG: hypothetical protein U0Y68_07265 [Blastocatellia bacterium]